MKLLLITLRQSAKMRIGLHKISGLLNVALFVVIVCTTSQCKKWTILGDIASSASVRINDQTYQGEEKFGLYGGRSGYIDATHRNDSSFFIFHLPVLYNNESAQSVHLALYIVDPFDTQRPINGKTYDLKRGLQVIINDENDRQGFHRWTITDCCLNIEFIGEEEKGATIRDGYMTYHERRITGDPYDVTVNCDFSATIELDNNELITLSEGEINLNRIYKNPELSH